MDDPGEWMTLSAAAGRLGRHLQRAQSRARREEWPKRRANKGAALEYLAPASFLAEAPAVSDSVASRPGTAGHSHAVDASRRSPGGGAG